MSDAAVAITDLSYQYGSTKALNGISLSIPQGCTFGLLGPNGSGKTTLFRILATLLPVPPGHVSILGSDPATAAAQVRSQLGITFQSPAVDVRLTVAENLYCHGRVHGISRAILRQRIDETIERFALKDRTETLVGELSGGLRRRVELAKGLLHKPRLLLLDEPSSGLDPVARQQFWQLIRDEKQRSGMTVVVTTHLMTEAEDCDRIALLHSGRVIKQGSPAQLTESTAGQVVSIRCAHPDQVKGRLEQITKIPSVQHGDRLRFQHPQASQFLARIMSDLTDEVITAEISRTSLEDVFIELTGHSLSEHSSEVS
jgi:ABC-2 type transport system ATP-binding protein